MSEGKKAELAKAIPRRPQVTWLAGLLFAFGFALFVTPTIHAERLMVALGAGHVTEGQVAQRTVRVPPFAGYETAVGQIGGIGVEDVRTGECDRIGCGGVLVARGDEATKGQADAVEQLRQAVPHGPIPIGAYFLLVLALAGLYAHHVRRSNFGRLVRVQLVNFALMLVVAGAVKVIMLMTPASVLVVPVALFAMLPTLALDRVVGLATGTLSALVVALLVPFDVGVAILLLVQAGVAGLVIQERPKSLLRAILVAGGATTLFTLLTYPLLVYLMTWQLPFAELRHPFSSPWLAATIAPAIATALAVPLLPLYQLAVGEITHGRLVQLEDLSHPLLRQIAEKSPGTWQHSLMMANMAEIAANAIGANGRLVRVGAYFHDLGKSLAPKYFIENLEPGETSPHDQLPADASCDAIFQHVTEGIKTARRAGLHERIVDFMHMHHGNGVLEYFWAKNKDQGNPKKLEIENFRYPGVPPQTRETAILAICDAVEAASRTLKKPEPQAIETLVQRIVYGKLHLGQLDESGLSMSDLRRITDSLRETIRHANHGRIEYPWQKAQQDASASVEGLLAGTAPRLDSLDRPARAETVKPATPLRESQEAVAATGAHATPKLRVGKTNSEDSANALAIVATAPAPQPGLPSTDSLEQTKPRARPVSDRPPTASQSLGGGESSPASSSGRRLRIDVTTDPPPITNPGLRVRSPSDPPPTRVGYAPSDAPANKATVTGPAPAPDFALLNTKPGFESAAVSNHDRDALAIAASVSATDSRPRPPTNPQIVSPEVAQFAREAAHALEQASKDLPAVPKSETRKRAATIPPLKKVMIPPPKMTIPGPLVPKPPAKIVEDDAAATNPRLEPAPDSTDPRFQLPNEAWREGLAARIDAQLDDEFGTDTPVIAPTRADLQALVGSPDATKVQSVDEIDRLRAASDRRTPMPTAEVDESDIEAAIDIAPPARRTGSIGVAKKKPPGE